MDGFPEDLREVVNDHWGKFPPAHPLIVSFFGTFYLLVTIVCVIGNFILIYVFTRTKHLRTPGNMFIVNLAVSDAGIFLTQGPLMFINSFSSRFWMWGAAMCKLYGFLGAVFGKSYKG